MLAHLKLFFSFLLFLLVEQTDQKLTSVFWMMLLTEEDSCTSEDLFDVLMVNSFLLIKVIPPVDRILAFDKPIALIHYALGFCKLNCKFRFCTLNGGTGYAGQPQRVHLAPFEMSPADLTQWNSSDLRFHRQQFIFAWIRLWKRLQKSPHTCEISWLGGGVRLARKFIKIISFQNLHQKSSSGMFRFPKISKWNGLRGGFCVGCTFGGVAQTWL